MWGVQLGRLSDDRKSCLGGRQISRRTRRNERNLFDCAGRAGSTSQCDLTYCQPDPNMIIRYVDHVIRLAE